MGGSFVGRDAELEDLRSMAAAVKHRHAPGAALIAGEPGAGKSRLLKEAIEAASFPNTIDIAGFEPERTVQLSAAAVLLKTLAASGEDDPLESFLRGAETADAFRVFELAHRAAVKMRPLLIAADDLQWADTSSLALLHYLLRAADASGHPLLLLAATRASPATASLASSIERALGSRDLFVRLDLGPLDPAAGAALAQRLDPALSAAQGRDMWERAGGSPFWIEDLAANPQESGTAPSAAARLRDLSSDAAYTVAALAIAGRPVLVDELPRLLGWPKAKIDAAVREAVSRGAALESSGTIRIAHDLIRETALHQIPTELARSLHERIASHLARDAGDDVGRLLSAMEHLRASGRDPVQLVARILSSPRRRLIGEEGLHSLVAVATENPGRSPDATLFAQLGELAAELGDHRTALQCWESYASGASDVDAATASAAAAREAYRLGDRERAERLLEQARRGNDPVLAIDREATDATIRMWLAGDLAGAAGLASRALGSARRSVSGAGGIEAAGDRLARAYRYALNVAFESAILGGHDAVGMDLAREIRAASRNDAEVLDADMTLGAQYRRLERWSDAEEILRRVWTDAHAHALPEITMASGYRLATVLLAMGRLDEAEEVATESDVLGERIGGLAWTTAWFHADWFGAEHHRGDWRAAISKLRARADALDDPHYRSGPITEAIRWESRYGRADSQQTVIAMIDRCRSDLANADCARCSATFPASAGEAYARIGMPDRAEEEIRGWDEREAGVSRVTRLRVSRTRALIEGARGNEAATLELFAQLIPAAVEAGHAIEEVWTTLDCAEAFASAGKHPAAEEWYSSAAEAARRIGALTEARIAEQGLRKLGVRAWKRPPGAGASLSERERQVADLVVRGASNPEIAATLFLSRKTVERHVSNILAKVGARNRTELAARLSAGQSPSDHLRHGGEFHGAEDR